MAKNIFIKAKENFKSVTIRYRTPENKVVVEEIPYINYFYIKKDDFEYYAEAIDKYCQDYEDVTASNGSFKKLILVDNFKRYYCKEALEEMGVKTYEADFTASKRYLLNHADEYEFNNYRACHLDFESDDRKPRGRGFKGELVFGDEQITGCSIVDEEGKKFFLRNENPDNHETALEERKLIIKILKILDDYDIVTAYAGNFFDFPFLKHRMEYHKKNYEEDFSDYLDLKLINKIDFMDLYIRYMDVNKQKHDKYSLEAVASDTVGDGKINFADDVKGGGGRFYDLWKNNPEKFREYNEKDVDLMKQIDEKFNLLTIHKVLTSITKNTPEECMFNSHMCDGFLIREEHKIGKICNSKPNKDEIERRKEIVIAGGHIEVTRGHYKNVSVFDYASHYPLCINTWNISPETLYSTMEADLNEVKEAFTEDEFRFIMKVYQKIEQKDIKLFLKESGVNGLEVSMKFNDVYQGFIANKYAHDNNLLMTPADLNNDKEGWHFHHHRFFIQGQGALPKYVGDAVRERNGVKYERNRRLKEEEDFKGSPEEVQMFAKSEALKVKANSGYGFTGFRSTRYFNFDIADTITTCARVLIKKAINKVTDLGYFVAYTHTDSIYVCKDNEKIDTKKLDNIFHDLYSELFKDFNGQRLYPVRNPRTGNMDELNYWVIFEHEDDIDAILMSAKSRNYSLLNGEVKTTGGAFKKNDTNPLAKVLQKQLCEDCLRDEFSEEKWVRLLDEWKGKCFDNKLDDEFITMRKKYSKHYSEYGKPMIDKKTGLQKATKDGTLRFSNIPAQIKLVKRLEAHTGEEFPLEDTILYVIGKPVMEDIKSASRKALEKQAFIDFYNTFKDEGLDKIVERMKKEGIEYKPIYATTQRAITLDEVKAGEQYDNEHYWNMIMKPIIEILTIVNPKTYFKDFEKIIGLSERQVKKLQDEIEKESE